jgi:hypothetical protein
MLTTDLHTVLSSFSPIGLNEMDDVRLMNRVETKYVFSSGKLPALLEQLSGIYKVLEVNNKRISPYHTIYLDTPELLFYTQQVRGKLSRYKIRYREYESTGMSFLEIKKKTNKNRTNKWRIENRPDSDYHDEESRTFIRDRMPDYIPDLQPVLVNNFNRITLVGVKLKERITLDCDLIFAPPDQEYSSFPFLAIAELKSERHSAQSPFVISMKKLGIRSTGFSKYCIGSALTKDAPRKNILKQKILLINKIENEYLKSSLY